MNEHIMSISERGRGPAVVLIHGFPGNAADFEPLAADLARTHRVLIPDLLGFGQSATPTGSLWIDRQADTLDAALTARGVDSAILVGHDVGGPVATWLASRWRGRARALVVASCSLVKDPPLPPPFRLLGLPLLGALVEAVLFSGIAMRALGRFATNGAGPTRNTSRELVSIRRIFATALRDLPGHYAELERRIERLAVPSVFVVGEKDPFFNPAFAQRMATALRARLEIAPGVGHFPQLEAPAVLADVVRSFSATSALTEPAVGP